MKLFARADSALIKKTIDIYSRVIGDEKKYLILSSIFVPLQHFCLLVLLPLLISFFTQSLILDPENLSTPLWLVAGIVATAILAFFTSHFGFRALFNHQERMTTKLTEYSLRQLLAHSHNFFANTKLGSLAGDINGFSQSYRSLLDVLFLQGSNIFVSIITSLIVIGFVAPPMLPVLLLMTLIIFYSSVQSFHKRSEYRNERKERVSKLSGNIADVIGNQTLVRTFGRSQTELQHIVAERNAIDEVAAKEINTIQNGAELRMTLMFGLQITVLLICLWLFGNDSLSIAALIFIITYLGRLTGNMFAINAVIRLTEQAFLDAAKITEILQLSPEVVDKENASELSLKTTQIEIKDMSFKYENDDEQIVFDRFNCTIPTGQNLGLVGRSGGGKSTFTHLLLRYMDIHSGKILIDGQNIADVTQESLRSQISYVPQDPYLFHRTLRDNIGYGRPGATDEEIITAAKKAYAWEFIEKLPKGLDTIVGERGVKLSGGQRQRIAIARAILKDAPILVLDEATSALDSESEKLIQKALESLMKNRTSIVIAHRLSTISKLDRIIVLDEGKIVEDGTHAELLKSNGTYARLWNHQSGGFIEE